MKTKHGNFSWKLFAAFALLVSTSIAQAQEDTASSPGTINFIGKNMVATADGVFHNWKFTKADFDREDPSESVVEIEVDVASIDTGIEDRDDHLRTADFFDVENYPVATLRFHDISSAGQSESGHPQYSASLDWSMHGIEKTYQDFTFEVIQTDPVKVAGTFTINRMDFEIGEPHKKLNPMSIKEEIPITFEAALPDDE